MYDERVTEVPISELRAEAGGAWSLPASGERGSHAEALARIVAAAASEYGVRLAIATETLFPDVPQAVPAALRGEFSEGTGRPDR
jgi:hypothetical protein